MKYDCYPCTRKIRTQREDSHKNVKVETGVMLPLTKEYLGLPEAGRGRKDAPQWPLRAHSLAKILISEFYPPRTVIE